MNLMKINKINVYCYAFFAIYAVITLSVFGFGVYFLEEMGFSYVAIGMTIGLSALIASIIQPLIGRFADIKQYSWKNILIAFAVIMLICSLGIYIAPHSLLIILFGINIIVFGCMYPFINQAVFYYEDHGIKTNFGVSRGFGSLAYMIFASVLGVLLAKTNIMIINTFTLVSSIAMLIVLYLAPYYGSNIDNDDGTGSSENKRKTKGFRNNVIIKYPIFTLAFIAVTLLMVFHNIFMAYMIDIFKNVGGTVTDVALASSIAAFLELPTMFLFAKLLERISAKKLIVIASLFYVARSVIILIANTTTGIYISLVLQMVSFAIMIPASVHLTNELMADEDKYEGQSFMGSTQTIGIIFGNFIGGNILQFFDVDLLLIVLVILTVMGSLFALSTLVVGEKNKTELNSSQ